MDAVVDRYFPVLDAIESELERVEEHLFQEGGFAAREHRGALLREAEAHDAASTPPARCWSIPASCSAAACRWSCHGLGEYFRDVYDHLVRINQSIDAARDTMNTAIQVALAMVNMGHGEITKRLAAYAALVAVPTMIAGVYGMNFEHMPELKWALWLSPVDRG